MTVSVLVPWRPSPDRVPLWAHIRPWWERLGYEVVEGTCPNGEPWCKAAAVADALERATGEMLIVADADVWCDGTEAAIERVRAGRARWAIPHMMVRRLTPEATAGVLAGGDWPDVRGRSVLDRPAYPGFPGGGLVVLRRETYESIPLDRRFTGWGGEDESWSLALTMLAGEPWRGNAPLWHLWHEPQPRTSHRYGSAESRVLTGRYRRAAFDGRPEVMRALVDGGR